MKLKRIICVLFTLIIFSSMSLFSASALSEASFSGNTAVSKGEIFDITLSFYSTEDIGHVQTNIAYDSSILEFVSSTSGTGSGGVISADASPADSAGTVNIVMTFKGISDGDCNIHIQNCAVYSPQAEVIGAPSAYINITVSGGDINENTETSVTTTTTETETEETEGTTNKTSEGGIPAQGVLKSLTVDHGKLVPDFSYDIYDYTVNVDYSVDNVEIEGETASVTDYIWYSGTSECSVGSNVRTITVTDVDGVSTTYTITIIRAEEGTSVEEENDEQLKEESNSSSSAVSSSASKSSDAMEKYKKILNPALAIVLVVLIIALVVIIVWIRSKLFEMKKK